MLNSVTAATAVEPGGGASATSEASSENGNFSEVFEAAATESEIAEASSATDELPSLEQTEALELEALESDSADLPEAEQGEFFSEISPKKDKSAEPDSVSVDLLNETEADGESADTDPLIELIHQARAANEKKANADSALNPEMARTAKDNPLLQQGKNHFSLKNGATFSQDKILTPDLAGENIELSDEALSRKNDFADMLGIKSKAAEGEIKQEGLLQMQSLISQLQKNKTAQQISLGGSDTFDEQLATYDRGGLSTANIQTPQQAASAVNQTPLQMQQPANALAGQLNEKIMVMMAGKLHQADIEVHPSELGPMKIRIEMDGDQATLQFSAHHSATREAIDLAIPRLRELFDRQQINLGEVNVDSGQAGHTGENADGGTFAGDGDGHNKGSAAQSEVTAAEAEDPENWNEVPIAPAKNSLDFYA